MSMRSTALAVLLALFAILPTAAEAAVAKIPAGAKIAVMPIGAYGDAAVYDAGRAASEYVMAVLRKESRYTLYDCDPEIVADRLDELGLSLAGLTENDAAMETAKLFDADYVVRGNVLSLGDSHSSSGFLLVAQEQHTITAHIRLRIVDVRTGAIVMASKGEGDSTATATNLDLQSASAIASYTSGGGHSVSLIFDDVAWGGHNVSTENLDRALRAAAVDAVRKLLTNIDGKQRDK